MKRSFRNTVAGAMLVASLPACGTPGNNIEACPAGWTGPEVSEPGKVLGVLSAIGQMAISGGSGSIRPDRSTRAAFADDSFYSHRNNADEGNEVFCRDKGDGNKVVLNPHGAGLVEVASLDKGLSDIIAPLKGYLPYTDKITK